MEFHQDLPAVFIAAYVHDFLIIKFVQPRNDVSDSRLSNQSSVVVSGYNKILLPIVSIPKPLVFAKVIPLINVSPATVA